MYANDPGPFQFTRGAVKLKRNVSHVNLTKTE